jgi:hypothetical protein
MNKLFLTCLIASAPLHILGSEPITRKKKEESEQGVAGTINRGADIIIGTTCLLAAGLFAPRAYASVQEAYSESKNLEWWIKKETWMGFFDGKLDNDEKRVGGAYLRAIGWSSSALALAGIGLAKIFRGTGLIKR